MRKLTIGTLAAAFAFVLAAPTNGAAVPVPPPDVDPINAEIPAVPFTSFDECVESGFCADTYTNEDGMTCPLVSEFAVIFGDRFQVGPYLITVFVGGYVCSYGECGVVSDGFAIILIDEVG